MIEIGAISSDGSTPLFDANLGNRADYDEVIKDIIPTTSSPLKFECRFSHGNIDTNLLGGVSIKILCSKFSRTINAGEVLRFVFEVKNPTFSLSPKQIVVPLNILVFDVDSNRIINHILIENSSLFVSTYDTTDIISSDAIFTTSTNDLA